MLVRPTRSLSFKLVNAVVLTALLIGFSISALQIFIDFSSQKKLPAEDMASLSSIVKFPATSIVFNLDKATANQLLRGILKHPAVTSCKLILAEGAVFAAQSKAISTPHNRRLNDLLFGQTITKNSDLIWQFPDYHESVGTLEITVDTYYYGRLFLDRAWITLASTLLYALALTAIFLIVFYVLVKRPLISVIKSIKQVDVDAPEKTRLVEPKGHDKDEIGLLTRFTNNHLEAIATSLAQVRATEEKLKQYSEGLETTVSERTQALTESLNQLQAAQGQLIESEKLAALGGLVAGVAHEVNTPLGVAVTAASILEETLTDMQTQFSNETMTAEGLQKLIHTAQDSQLMLSSNLNRATKLIKDFKMTAVDQLSENCCEFNVSEVIHALLESLVPETKKIPVTPTLACPSHLTMNSLPGVLTQVLSNLIVNSVKHAFEQTAHPQIHIIVYPHEELVIVEYRDNGAGVPESLHQRVFEPFFTTKRGQGGSGLGLNIVYNLVTRKLLGRLEFISSLGQGVHFKLYLPIAACAMHQTKQS
ncbi:MAG: ATP-binding protein [Pseudomonadota bacterium]